MSDTKKKARALRLERLQTMLDKNLGQPPAALETLMSELRVGEARPELWEKLHAAAARDGKELDLANAYRKIAIDRRLKQLSPQVHAEVLMHAADFFQGVLGDGKAAEAFLQSVLEVAPGHPEAYKRLERRFGTARNELGLGELYPKGARAPPKTPRELGGRPIKNVAALPAKTPPLGGAGKA